VLLNILKALSVRLLKVPGDTTVRSDISLWEQLENRPALSDSPLLAEKPKSNVPNHSYNPACPQATRNSKREGGGSDRDGLACGDLIGDRKSKKGQEACLDYGHRELHTSIPSPRKTGILPPLFVDGVNASIRRGECRSRHPQRTSAPNPVVFMGQEIENN
jgi:hypothetical protein